MAKNFRDLFGFDPSIVYFNHAATGMLPTCSADAMNQYIQQLKIHGEPPIEDLLRLSETFKSHAAQLLNVPSRDIAFIKNTTDGLEIALFSIDWKPGDNMVVQEDAFPASLYLAAYCFPNVEKRYVPLHHPDDFYHRLENKIDGHTRAVVVDYVHFISGDRLDLRRLGEIVRRSNSVLVVDGIQALGAIAVDLAQTPVDFFAAGGMKWLQGPAGSGVLYTRPEIMETLTPFRIGWFSAEYEDFSSLYPVRPLKKDAGRFRPANDNYIGLVGLTESLRMLNDVGAARFESTIMEMSRELMKQLDDLGCTIFTPRENTRRAGIVSFKLPGVDSHRLYEALTREQIVCSLREGWVRIAIHFYNTKQEINKVVELIESNL
ncbi:MAG: aminotransferase class V-fold PLP-dependent enzyme [Candidatus Zhuqueibacterota bacterium]